MRRRRASRLRVMLRPLPQRKGSRVEGVVEVARKRRRARNKGTP